MESTQVVTDLWFNKAKQLVLIEGAKWSLDERKTYNFFLSWMTSPRYTPDDLAFEIPASELHQIFYADGKRTGFGSEELKAICNKISSTKIKYFDDETGDWVLMNVLPFCSYSSESRIFKIELTPSYSKFIRDPRASARISLVHQQKYASTPALAMYELCSLMVLIQKEAIHPIEFIVKLLGLSEKTPFKQHLPRTIMPIVEQINNNKHGFIVSLTSESIQPPNAPRKVGRKPTTHVKITIQLDPKNIDNLGVDFDEEILKLLHEIGIANKEAKPLILIHGANVILTCYQKTIADVERRKDTNDPISSPSGWLIKMLNTEDWLKSKPASDIEITANKALKRKGINSEAYQLKQRRDNAWQYFIYSDAAKKTSLLNEFKDHLSVDGKESVLLRLLLEDGVANVEVHSVFIDWLLGWKEDEFNFKLT